MKTASFMLAAALLTNSGLAQTGGPWERQSGTPSWTNLLDMGVATASHVFVPGPANNLLESTDGGESWITRTFDQPPQETMYKITFVDALHGWLGGNSRGNGITACYRTIDGGQTWLNMPNVPGGSWDIMKFLSPNFGWMTASQIVSITTNDGGQTWQLVPIGDEYARVMDGLGSTLIARTATGYYRSTNLGGSWQFSMSNPDGNFGAAAFISPMHVVIGTTTGIFHSGDGGASFQRVASTSAVYRITRLSDTSAVAHTDTGLSLVSTDAGVTWQPGTLIDDQQQVPWRRVDTLIRAADTIAIATTADGKIRRSIDSGRTWTNVNPGPRPGVPLMGARALGNTVYLSGNNGLMYRSDDTGATWKQISRGIGSGVNGLKMFDDRRGFAVTDDGTVLTTTNAGQEWSPRRPLVEFGGGGNYLYAVAVVPPNFAFATGDYGYMIRTLDAGVTWEHMPTSLAAEMITSVKFLTPNVGYCAASCCLGSAGIFKTTDGGVHWTSLQSVNSMNLGIEDIDFIDEMHGWAVRGDNSDGVFRTTDGFATQSFVSLDPAELFSISFADLSTGWVGGYIFAGGGSNVNRPYLAKTTDGGISWNEQSLPGSLNFAPGDTVQDIRAVSTNEVWCATIRGRLLHTTDGGDVWSIVDPQVPSIGAPSEALRAIEVSPSGRVWSGGDLGKIIASPGPSCCAADFNCDGFVNGGDFDEFVQAFEAGDAAADFDGDTFITGVDFDLFVQAFEVGC